MTTPAEQLIEQLIALTALIDEGARAVAALKSSVEKLSLAYAALAMGMQTRELRIVDTEGRCVARLAVSDDGRGTLALCDPATGAETQFHPVGLI